MRKRKKNKLSQLSLSSDTKRDIFVIFIFAIAFLSILSLFDLADSFGQSIDKFWQITFGWGWWLWPFILIIIGYLIINKEKYEIPAKSGKAGRWIGLFLFILTFSGILNLFVKNEYARSLQGEGGGLVGYIVSMPLEKIVGFWGALIILIALFLISLLLFFGTSINVVLKSLSWILKPSLTIPILSHLREKIKQRQQQKELEKYKIEDIGFEQREISEIMPFDESKEIIKEKDVKLSHFAGKTKSDTKILLSKHYPKIDLPVNLLNGKLSIPTSGDIKANQETIKKTLASFGIEVEMGEVSVGPTVTQYTLKPSEGIKLSQITSLINDLALALAAHPLRIEAPIPGKSLVGIEVPNQKVALVSLKEVLASEEFRKRQSNLFIALGKDVAGKPWLANLEKMPHLLVAGSTGSGKTVCLNSIIVSLLYQNQPDETRLILVDPKRVELPVYNGIPHLICPVITDVKKTVNALRWSVKEMDRRFEILSKAGKRNITVYNASHPNEKMPYLALIIDELADLMAVASVEVEQAIIRLSQMARATGIHLIVATQRPSVDVITGLIKANITSRIAFSVASITDSRTILDHAGAEKLLGRGDMLFISPEISKPKRIQGSFVSDDEIERVVRYLKHYQGGPNYDEEVTQLSISSHSIDDKETGFEQGDELLPEAKEMVIRAGKASASYLQRRLRIGYARAARLLDLLEEQGVIGPADGSKPREVLIKRQDYVQDEELHRLEQAHKGAKKIEDEEFFDKDEKKENDDLKEIEK